MAVGPADLEPVDLGGGAEPVGQGFFGSREIGLAARDLLRDRPCADRRKDTRPDRVAAGPAGPDEPDSDALPGAVEVVHEDPRGAAVLDHNDVEVSVGTGRSSRDAVG